MEHLLENAAAEIEALTAADHIGVIIIAALLILAAFFILTKPLRMVVKLALNTVCGFVALIAVNYLGAFIGVTIGVNWLNAVVVGVLGVPGVALLFILRWLMLL